MRSTAPAGRASTRCTTRSSRNFRYGASAISGARRPAPKWSAARRISCTTEAELNEKVKVAYAQYYQADQALHTTEDLHLVVHDIALVARDRYAQGRSSQPEVYKAEVESTRLATELVRLETRRRSAAARLNALLLRPIDAPLAQPRETRAMPQPAALAPAALMERARAGNPSLAGGEAKIAAAAAGKQLADKSWYPDVTLKAGAIDRNGNGPNGYLAEIGFRVPFQWGLHAAQQREAAAQLGASQARRQALELQIQSELGGYVADLAGSRRTAELIRRSCCRRARRCCGPVSPVMVSAAPS